MGRDPEQLIALHRERHERGIALSQLALQVDELVVHGRQLVEHRRGAAAPHPRVRAMDLAFGLGQ